MGRHSGGAPATDHVAGVRPHWHWRNGQTYRASCSCGWRPPDYRHRDDAEAAALGHMDSRKPYPTAEEDNRADPPV